MPIPRVAFVFLFLAVCLASQPLRAETLRSASSPLRIPQPAAGLVAYAARHGIPLQGISFASDAGASRAGDETIFLLDLQHPAGARQWLVRLVADMPARQKEEPKPLREDIIFTSTGLELHYPNTPAVLDIEFIGPFGPDTPGDAAVTISRGRTIVGAESLELGLIHYCESSVDISRRLKAAGITDPVYQGFGKRPGPDAIAAGRKAAAAFQLTSEEERLAFSVYFALRSFYAAAAEIPACRAVLEQVLQKPSLWSVAKSLGLNTNFEYGWHEVSRLPDGPVPGPGPVYALPVKLALNDQPALKVSLAVTTTQPPLRNCAGIVSLVAEHPADPGKRVQLHLLSARPAQ